MDPNFGIPLLDYHDATLAESDRTPEAYNIAAQRVQRGAHAIPVNFLCTEPEENQLPSGVETLREPRRRNRRRARLVRGLVPLAWERRPRQRRRILAPPPGSRSVVPATMPPPTPAPAPSIPPVLLLAVLRCTVASRTRRRNREGTARGRLRSKRERAGKPEHEGRSADG